MGPGLAGPVKAGTNMGRSGLHAGDHFPASAEVLAFAAMTKKRRKVATHKPTTCPCDTGKPYAECCGPLHAGERTAADAVELMRSRYSGFVLGLPDYLWGTLHSEHETHAQGIERYRAAMQSSSSGLRYRKLRILDSREPDAQGVAQVLFFAEIAQLKRDHSIVELSSFVQEDGQWRYIAGITRRTAQLAHGIEDLSIDHWDCGGHP